MLGDAHAVIESEILVEYPLHFVELAIVAEACVFRRSRYARLLRIELPYVKIRHERCVSLLMPVLNRVPHKRVRDLAKVISARDGQQAEPKIARRIREFPYRLAVRVKLVRRTLELVCLPRRQKGRI